LVRIWFNQIFPRSISIDLLHLRKGMSEKPIYNFMEALRNIYTVENHRIVIDLPKSFNHTSVEIIILPIEKTGKRKMTKTMDAEKHERLKKLLSINVWNEEDILPIVETPNLINQWKIEKF